MKIWLDDVREAPEGWHWARSAEEVCAKLLAHAGEIETVSLDNDLGVGYLEGRHVAKLIYALALSGSLPPILLRVHTDNPVARQEIVNWFEDTLRIWKG